VLYDLGFFGIIFVDFVDSYVFDGEQNFGGGLDEIGGRSSISSHKCLIAKVARLYTSLNGSLIFHFTTKTRWVYYSAATKPMRPSTPAAAAPCPLPLPTPPVELELDAA
jgi:hypothetical protein